MSDQDKIKSDRFFKLYIENQRRIFSYILMLVPNKADAEDILQTTASISWTKFDQFSEGTHFGAWAVKIAQNVIYDYAKKKKRARVIFDVDMLDVYSQTAVSKTDEQNDQFVYLDKCIQKLRNSDRYILKLRYGKGYSIKKISELIQRPLQGLYKATNRIHNQLLDCIQHAMLVDE